MVPKYCRHSKQIPISYSKAKYKKYKILHLYYIVVEEVMGNGKSLTGAVVQVEAVASVWDDVGSKIDGTGEERGGISRWSVGTRGTLPIRWRAKQAIKLTVDDLYWARIGRFCGPRENSDQLTRCYYISMLPIVPFNIWVKGSLGAVKEIAYGAADGASEIEKLEMHESLGNANPCGKDACLQEFGQILYEVHAPAGQDKSVKILWVELCRPHRKDRAE